MFSFERCAPVPEQSGRGYGGGLVEVEGSVVWGRGGLGGQGGRVYRFDEVNSKWERLDDVDIAATLAVCGGEFVTIGGFNGRVYNNGIHSKEVKVRRGGRWTSMAEMLVGCYGSCVVSVSDHSLVAMGGQGVGPRTLNVVQVFDGLTWHMGPPLPRPCAAMSAVVHGNLVFAMGGGADMERAVWSANITELVSH